MLTALQTASPAEAAIAAGGVLPAGPVGPIGPQGIQGPQGNPGPIGASGPPGVQGLSAWGTEAPWAASTVYSANAPASLVFFNNATYVCVVSHTSTGSFDASKWQLVVQSTVPNPLVFSAYSGFSPGSNLLGQLVLSGSFGGGLLLQDGTTYLGIWSNNFAASMNFGVGATTSFGSASGNMVLTASSLTIPGTLVGGSGTGSTLTLESTSAAGSGDFINFKTGSQVERMRLDSNGNVNIGNQGGTIADVFGGGNPFQVNHSAGNASIEIGRYSADISGPYLTFQKSRNTTIGSGTALSSGDVTGIVMFSGYDATATPVLQQSVYLQAQVDAAPTAGSLAGRIAVFTAASGSGSPTERLRIDSNGNVNIGNAGAILADVFTNKPILQLSGFGNAVPQASIDIRSYANVQFGAAYLSFTRSRGSSIGSNVGVSNNDNLSGLFFTAYDATATPALQQAASISIFADGAPTAGSVPGRITFLTAISGSGNPSERLRIDSVGRTFFGRDNGAFGVIPNGGSLNPSMVLAGTSYGGSEIVMANFGANGNDANFIFLKSRATGVQSAPGAAVVSGDGVLDMNFFASDGTNWTGTAFHACQIDGAVSAGVVPMRFIWQTGPTNTGIERLRIDSNGFITQGGFANTQVGGFNALLETNQTGGGFWDFASVNYNAHTGGIGGWAWLATQASTPGGHSALSSGDKIGQLSAYGDDGTNNVKAAQIEADVDGAVSTGVVPGRWRFITSGVERLRIDSGGLVNIGNQGAIIGSIFGVNPIFQVSTNNGSQNFAAHRYSNDSNAPYISFVKSRSGTIGTNTVVQSGDGLGYIDAGGFDATGTPVLRESAFMIFECDATPTAGAVPGRIRFDTANSSGTLVEALRLDSNQQIDLRQTPNTNRATITTSNQSGVSVANGSNAAICPGFRGFIIIDNETGSGTGNGDMAIYLLTTSGNSILVGQAGSGTWVAPTTTPAAGKCSVANGNPWNVYNNVGNTATFKIFAINQT